MSITRKIARGSAILIVGNAVGYLLALFKEVLVAARYGVGLQMDAFYAALTVPNLITNVLIAAFTAIFIPVFAGYQARTPESARKVSNVFITYLLLFLAVSTAALFLASGPLIRVCFPGFSPATAAIAAKLLGQLSWLVLLSGGVGISMGILSVHKDFTPQAFAPLFVTLAIIVFVVFFGVQLGVFALSWGLVAGVLAEVLFLLVFVYRKGFRFSPDFDYRSPEMQQVLTLILPFLIGSAIGQLNLVVDRFMASGLDAGSISALGYADKLVHVPTQVFNASLTTAAFPFFAALVAENKIDELKTTLASLIRIAAFVLIPVTVMLMLMSGSIIRLLFERGAFTPAATTLTSLTFMMFALQLFFTAAEVLMVRVFLALKEMRILVGLTVFSVVLNVVFNLVFIRLAKPAVAGIALSTSLVEAVSMFALLYFLRRKIGPLQTGRMLEGIKKISFASLLTAAAAVPVYKLAIGACAAQGFTVRAAVLTGFALAWTAVFFWVCHLLKLEETDKINKLVLSKFSVQKSPATSL